MHHPPFPAFSPPFAVGLIELVEGVRIVSDTTVARFTERTLGARALGWDICIGGGSCGFHFGPRAYGHTGYTGTSLWIDPDQQVFVIVLTNRVHPRIGPIDLKCVRQMFNTLAMEALDSF